MLTIFIFGVLFFALAVVNIECKKGGRFYE